MTLAKMLSPMMRSSPRTFSAKSNDPAEMEVSVSLLCRRDVLQWNTLCLLTANLRVRLHGPYITVGRRFWLPVLVEQNPQILACHSRFTHCLRLQPYTASLFVLNRFGCGCSSTWDTHSFFFRRCFGFPSLHVM